MYWNFVAIDGVIKNQLDYVKYELTSEPDTYSGKCNFLVCVVQLWSWHSVEYK
jgi:hypothetical protein